MDINKINFDLKNNGVSIVENYLSMDTVDRFIDFMEEINALQPRWVKNIKNNDGVFTHFSPLSLRKYADVKLINLFSKTFINTEIEEICSKYLGPSWVIDRLCLDYNIINKEPLTFWHADHFSHNRECIKFMLYLNNISSMSGAFSYIPGSNNLMKILRNKYNTAEERRKNLHYYEDIMKNAMMCINKSNIKKSDMHFWEKWIDDVKNNIFTNTESNDNYSISGAVGSLIIFDSGGIHRGGIISNAERRIIRSHCIQSNIESILSSKSSLHTYLSRKYNQVLYGDTARFF